MEELLLENINYITIFVFAIVAYATRMLDLTGSLVAIFFGSLILYSSGEYYLMLLISFLVIGSLFTRYKYDYKKKIGVCEPKGGRRSMGPVIANGIIPTFMAVLGNPYLLVGALSAALADTMATEIGVLNEKPVLITTGKVVKAGTRGAISLHGEVAAAIGASIIAILSILLIDVSHTEVFFIALISGLVGCNLDSLLGASMDFLSKEEINLLCTLTGAAASSGVAITMSLPV
ncbi:MAG: DUF92 domain-containing protein [Halobacteriota archaeon]|nr:DUF92 domain-containing protein [Halobacteriota archaeon]